MTCSICSEKIGDRRSTTEVCGCKYPKHVSCVKKEIKKGITTCNACNEEFIYFKTTRTSLKYNGRDVLDRMYDGLIISIFFSGLYTMLPGIGALVLGNLLRRSDVLGVYIILSIGSIGTMSFIFALFNTAPIVEPCREYLSRVWLVDICLWPITLAIKCMGYFIRWTISLSTDGFWDPRTVTTGLIPIGVLIMLAAVIFLVYNSVIELLDWFGRRCLVEETDIELGAKTNLISKDDDRQYC